MSVGSAGERRDVGVPRSPAEARRSHLESAAWRRTLLWGLRNVPVGVQHATMPLWAAFFYAQVPHVRRAIERNLERLIGVRGLRRRRAAFRTFTNYCRCVANAYRLHAGAELRLPAVVSGLERLRRYLDAGQGLILATAHLGNWQLGPYLLAHHGLPPVTVVMNAEPDAGAQQLEAALRDQRLRVVYAGQSPLLSLQLRAALARGELVGLQVDRPPPGTGLRVPCAGREASFAAGPAQLAWACGAPIVPVFFPLEGRGVRIMVEEPLVPERTGDRERDVRALTARVAALYAQMIRAYPEQWFNFYDFWEAEA